MIPLVLEESGGSERVFDIYSRLLRERIIFLGEQVTSETANRIVAQLLSVSYTHLTLPTNREV